MTTEPKLLTEAEWRDLLMGIHHGTDETLAELRARGLIAGEPVDPLLVEAKALVSAWESDPEGYDVTKIALAALRRGMELAPRKELTREMVREAVIGSEPNLLISPDFRSCYEETRQGAENFVTRLHAALTEALQ